ncbi:MAG TPA: M35 family metallo-endopeptidase, partial [Arenimonas sp.]|nr:M35 family metallo-endopeptidase [Arenimonas sp.]
STSAHAAKPVTAENPLSLGVFADAGDAFSGRIQFKLTNNGQRAVKVPYWQLPLAGDEAKQFDVMLDGQPVTYTGKMIKRGKPSAKDFVMLRPGETRVFNVDLSETYDLQKSGQYSVRFRSFLQNAQTEDGALLASKSGRMARLESVPMQLWVDGEAVRLKQELTNSAKAGKGKPGSGGGVVNGISYVGCSSTQINTLGSAVSAARNYSENSKGYLVGGSTGPRYTTWFGAYTSTRYNTAKNNFAAIDSAMDQSGGQIKINCGCNQSYYAYVYPTKPYEIFVCRAFWNAPTTGTDSKAGTLVHEMSHFNVVAGTDDHVYGQSGAKSLAISDPNRAVDNADSHEYFAENTPSQN